MVNVYAIQDTQGLYAWKSCAQIAVQGTARVVAMARADAMEALAVKTVPFQDVLMTALDMEYVKGRVKVEAENVNAKSL